MVIRASKKEQVKKSFPKTAEVTPMQSANCGNIRQPTARRQLFKSEESRTGTNANPERQFLKMAKQKNKKPTIEMQKVQVPKGKPANFCREMVENMTPLSKTQKKTQKQRTQTSRAASRRAQSTATEERAQPPPLVKGETKHSKTKSKEAIDTKKTVRKPQTLPTASPTKRRKTKDEESCEAKVSSMVQSTQMCPRSKRESLTDEKCSQKAPKEGCKAKCPTARPSLSKKRQKRGPKSSIQSPEPGEGTQQPGAAEPETMPDHLKIKTSNGRKKAGKHVKRRQGEASRKGNRAVKPHSAREEIENAWTPEEEEGCKQGRAAGADANPPDEFDQETRKSSKDGPKEKKAKPQKERKLPKT
ncbi:serine/arginine-rich splicing factor 4-like [Melanotaenia boesemani]|uniref:serine/arginine-rich splicing factor 4-like n=1 Tax=Melanotaenia boesemani TaxID=1250792 RepID=UPI001C03E3CB|nr:serine/arginine-rich splicing factor 4-like [Melanotaenia boesemani]